MTTPSSSNLFYFIDLLRLNVSGKDKQANKTSARTLKLCTDYTRELRALNWIPDFVPLCSHRRRPVPAAAPSPSPLAGDKGRLK